VKSLAPNTLEQNSSAERSRGVSMSEDEDETQVDISGSRQVDSGGNQNQATDREEHNTQDDDVIGPQASKDDLPTPILTPEPQSNTTTTESSSPSTNQKPQFKCIPDAGEEAIEHLPQSVTGPIMKGPTAVKSTACGVSKAHKIALRKPPNKRLRWQTSRKKKLKALKGELRRFVKKGSILNDGLTKALPRQKHKTFVQQLNLIHIKDLI